MYTINTDDATTNTGMIYYTMVQGQQGTRKSFAVARAVWQFLFAGGTRVRRKQGMDELVDDNVDRQWPPIHSRGANLLFHDRTRDIVRAWLWGACWGLACQVVEERANDALLLLLRRRHHRRRLAHPLLGH